MREKKTVSVELDIGELMGLIEYCNKMSRSIPPELYDNPTLHGSTFGETAKKYKDRATELYELLNAAWPK